MGGGVDISLPNISYCEDVKDIHYNPYNTVEFYVGEITGTETVKIYTDANNHVDITIDKGNKWYSYVLPKDKGLYKIESGIYDEEEGEWSNGIVTKAVVKANITTSRKTIIPSSTVEASFKGSNTSNVTLMNGMFNECSGLKSLDVSNFDTSNVTIMSSMFEGCRGLKSLDVSNFDTSNVTSMGNMFFYCSGLKSLDVSNFDTSNVTYIGSMFEGCASLTSLNLSNFNTSNVTSMVYMFNGCNGLTSLNLSNFDTSNVTDMGWMFTRCASLEELDLSKWNTSKVIHMYKMFGGCSKLRTITMKGCDQTTIDKIKAQLKADGLSENIVKQ